MCAERLVQYVGDDLRVIESVATRECLHSATQFRPFAPSCGSWPVCVLRAGAVGTDVFPGLEPALDRLSRYLPVINGIVCEWTARPSPDLCFHSMLMRLCGLGLPDMSTATRDAVLAAFGLRPFLEIIHSGRFSCTCELTQS